MSLKSITLVWLRTLLILMGIQQLLLAQNPVANVAANSSASNTVLAVLEVRWEQVLLSAEDYIASGGLIQSQTELYQKFLDNVHASAKSFRQASLNVLGEIKTLPEVLGSAPDAEKNESEPEVASEQSHQY